jgi:hypothetical protein
VVVLSIDAAYAFAITTSVRIGTVARKYARTIQRSGSTGMVFACIDTEPTIEHEAR